ncbi:unnamed protein product [Rhizopus stolonifer]
MTSLMKSTISRDYTQPVLSSRLIPAVSLEVARRMRPRPPSVLLYESRQWQDVNHDSGFDSDTPESEDEGIDLVEDMLAWVNKICQVQLDSLKNLNGDSCLNFYRK